LNYQKNKLGMAVPDLHHSSLFLSKSAYNTMTNATETSNDGGGSVPSGFILKLYQMVNGAPDEVISVSAKIFEISKKENIGYRPCEPQMTCFGQPLTFDGLNVLSTTCQWHLKASRFPWD
jgi:hypothetical protein